MSSIRNGAVARNGQTNPEPRGRYARVAEAVRLYESAAWVGKHFGGDRRRAALYLERELVPELTDSWSGMEQLAWLLKEFPEPAEWEGPVLDVAALASRAWQREEARWQAENRRNERALARADRRSLRALLDGSVRDEFLRPLGDGQWHVLDRSVEVVIRDECGRRYCRLTGGPWGAEPEDEAEEGKPRLVRKLLSRLARQGIIEVVAAPGGVEWVRFLGVPEGQERQTVERRAAPAATSGLPDRSAHCCDRFTYSSAVPAMTFVNTVHYPGNVDGACPPADGKLGH